jgi:cobalt-zinc-cadmium resistance protein CzcA
MIDHIISFSIKNKLIVGLACLLLVGWGVRSISQISIDAVPDITNNQVQVITTSENLAAQEVEQFITYPVELAMGNIPGVIEIRSISRFGLSVVTIVFEEAMGTFLPRQLVSEKLLEAEENIGPGLGTPSMGPITTGLGEIYQYTLEPEPGFDTVYSAIDLRTINDWVVKRQLTMLPGVVDISSWGGYLKQYEVAIDPEKLNANDLTLSEILAALENNNENTGGSYIEKGPELYYIRGKGLIQNFDDVRQTVVTNRNGMPVKIGDVATVGVGYAPRYGAATKDGKGETVIGIVMMVKNENSAHVVERVKERIAEIQTTLPEGLVIKPFLDRTRLVDKTISTVTENLLIGGLIVILALIFFLGTWRAGLIVASVIPLSMLFALGMMNAFGVSANLMSLGALDFGIIVDGAVIIVEVMVVMLVARQEKIRGLSGTEKQDVLDEITQKGASRMMNAAIFGQIIILIVFIPILSLEGIEGKMFKPMAMTFGFAVIGAMLLCLTYVPMVASILLNSNRIDKHTWGDRVIGWMEKLYQPIIRAALKMKIVVVAGAVLLLIAAIFVFSSLGGEFIPKLDEGDFALETRMAPGTSLPEMTKNMNKLERILLDNFPEVTSVVTKIGAGEIPTDPMPIEGADVMVSLKDKHEWVSASTKSELAEKMEEALSVLPGVDVEFSQPVEMRFNELMTGIKQDIAVKIYGEDLEILQEKGNQAAAIIGKINGTADVKVEQVTGLPQVVIDYKRNRLAEYGLNISEVNQIVSMAFAGATSGKVFEGEKRFDLVVRLQKPFREKITEVGKLYISLPNGNKIPLSEVADISVVDAPAQISRDDTRRRIVIGVNVRNRDTQSLVEEMEKRLQSELKLPPGYSLNFGGQFENLQKAKARLSIAVPVALILIFLILFISLRSIKQTLLIYTAIPFAAVGGVFALWLRDMPFSISAGVGFIALFGVAVLNGLILITSLNELKKEGVSDVNQRIRKAATSRLRPIFLTAITDILGFLPMAVSGSSGAEVQRPLATVVIGGIITATLLTLVVLPALYAFVEKGGKFKKVVVTSSILLLAFIPLRSNAQQPIEEVSLETAIQLTLENNGMINAAEYEIESREALEGTSFNPAKTNFETQYGQYNSFGNDLGFSISQGFSFPTVYGNRARLLGIQTESARMKKRVTANELVAQVKFIWYEFILLEAQRDLLIAQDSIFVQFRDAANLRFKVGETNQLEQITAETRLMEIRNMVHKIEADIVNVKTQLQVLINSEKPVEFIVSPAIKREFQFDDLEGDSLNQNPTLQYLRQQTMVAREKVKLNQSERLPDFYVGYQNQSLQGFYDINGRSEFVGRGTRFQSISVGVSIPLWFKEGASRVKSAALDLKVEESHFEQSWKNFQGRMTSWVQVCIKQDNTVRFYEENLLPQADLMTENAKLGFSAGESDYLHYVQALNQAYKIKSEYLREILLFNQAIINLEMLIGIQK